MRSRGTADSQPRFRSGSSCVQALGLQQRVRRLEQLQAPLEAANTVFEAWSTST